MCLLSVWKGQKEIWTVVKETWWPSVTGSLCPVTSPVLIIVSDPETCIHLVGSPINLHTFTTRSSKKEVHSHTKSLTAQHWLFFHTKEWLVVILPYIYMVIFESLLGALLLLGWLTLLILDRHEAKQSYFYGWGIMQELHGESVRMQSRCHWPLVISLVFRNSFSQQLHLKMTFWHHLHGNHCASSSVIVACLQTGPLWGLDY